MEQKIEVYNKNNFIIPEGLKIDLEEGWKKIISRQFGGNPGKGFGELIQNFLDSYDSGVPWKGRRGIITFGDKWISLKDFGSGLDLNKIKLVTTIGGTDKSNDHKKIGKFGIGFFSIFNPKLGTRKVEITTMCEGQAIRLEYTIPENGLRPLLDYFILDHSIDFSTEVKVHFDHSDSVNKCLDYAKRSLRYYPCDIQINGGRFHSIWDEAKRSNAFFFNKAHCNGFIKTGKRYRSTTILCKYEYITELSLRYLITGGHRLANNLDDYSSNETPYLPGLEVVLNCDDLSLTISRDSYYLDYKFKSMISGLNASLLELMDLNFNEISDDIILANIYILRQRIKKYMERRPEKPGGNNLLNSVFEKLISRKAFNINGRRASFSILDLLRMKSKSTPLFFSENKTNLRWLGGEFKHDYIVLTEPFQVENGAPGFFNTLFTCIFDDVVNLDTINEDEDKVRSLIDRGIIRKESLEPACKFIEPRKLSKEENQILVKLEKLLNQKEVIDVIERNINIPVKKIHPSFFLLKNKAMHISTGLFDEHRNPINDEFISNFIESEKEPGAEERLLRKNTILLGLCLNHPFIRKLIVSEDPHKEFYALTYIAHELASCQKLLSPYSSFFNLVKTKLSSNLRKCMIHRLAKAE